MNNRNALAARATAFGFAVFVTLSILASVDRLATQPAVEWQLARQAAPAQVVVIEAVRPSNT